MSSTPLTRSKFGRDPRKGEGQRKALEGSTALSPAAPKSYNLIICGATNHQHGFIFSDFMGFCMALREQGVGGDFLSCFPLERHFMYLKNEHDPPIDTIKFGKIIPNGDRYVYSYSRHSYVNRQYWFRQVGASILLNEVEKWISQKKQHAKTGDVVNIVFECHGDKARGLKVGSSFLHRHVFREMTTGFQDGVQVNAIMDACYSGPFVDAIKDTTEEHRYAAAASDEEAWSFTRSASNRIRDSRFSQAFVQSLAKLNLPGTPRRKVTWRLKDHEDLICDMTMRNITPNANTTTPRFYTSAPLNGMSAVEDMVFRRKIDVLFDPKDAFGRRRVEWPTGDMNAWQMVQGDPESEQIPQSAKTLVDFELSKCDSSTGFVPDIQIFDQMFTRHPRYRSLMRNLYWRSRRQSTIWQIFKLLLHRAYINPTCLHLPIAFDQYSTSDAIVSLLQCFSFVDKDSDELWNDNIPLQGAAWNQDFKWLAVMITRGGENIVSIFNLIAACGVLGNCNIQLLDEFRQENPGFIFYNDPQDCVLKQGTGRLNQKFGLWLSPGLEPEKFQERFSECEKHAERIESAFQKSEPQLTSKVDQYGASENEEVLVVPVEWDSTTSLEAGIR